MDLPDRVAAEYVHNLPLIDRPPFLRARVGTIKTMPDYELALSQTDPVCKLGNWAGNIMNKEAFVTSIPQIEEDINFVVASNEEFGYQNGCTRLQTYEAGLKLGWELCLPSDGPEIRRHYLSQPRGELLLVAMEPVEGSNGYGSNGCLEMFSLECDSYGLWLLSRWDVSEHVWDAETRWVFRRK